MCIDLPTSVAMGSSPIPPVSGWQNCDLDSAVKLQAQACVFDSKIFQISGQRIGSIAYIHTYMENIAYIHTYIHTSMSGTMSARKASLKAFIFSKIRLSTGRIHPRLQIKCSVRGR